MPPAAMDAEARAAHWRGLWRGKDDPFKVTWAQDTPVLSLEMIAAGGIDPSRPLIDAGGGAATLVDHLLARGWRDLTVLDLAPEALAHARARLGERAGAVHWIAADLLHWTPPRRYALWHDRAVFHFLETAAQRRTYGATLRRALAPDGRAVIAGFAPEGPQQCSGLPVTRNAADELPAALGGGFTVLEERRETHRTPAGGEQAFLWALLAPD